MSVRSHCFGCSTRGAIQSRSGNAGSGIWGGKRLSECVRVDCARAPAQMAMRPCRVLHMLFLSLAHHWRANGTHAPSRAAQEVPCQGAGASATPRLCKTLLEAQRRCIPLVLFLLLPRPRDRAQSPPLSRNLRLWPRIVRVGRGRRRGGQARRSGVAEAIRRERRAPEDAGRVSSAKGL